MTNTKNDCHLVQTTDEEKKESFHAEQVLPAVTAGAGTSIGQSGGDVLMIEQTTIASRMADALRCYD